jgi:pilus assembly protein CpaE
MPIIVEPNSTNSETILTVAGSSARVVGNLDDLRRELTDLPDEHAIVIGPSIDLDAAAAVADNLRVTRPAVSVILMRRRVDTSVLAEALRSGMREVVEERDLTGLGEAIKRALQVYQAVTGPSAHGSDAPVGRLLTVFSPKGGVGKTTIAANMAVALTNMDKRVCLVDLDLGFGDIAITLQLFPARTIADAVALEEGMDFTVLEPLLTPHRRGFTTLVAPVQPDAKDSIPPTLISKILSILKQHFDYVVVDTSPAFDEHVLQAFDETDELLLVTTLDIPTLKNVKIAVETLDLLNFPKNQRHLILNRADDKVGLSSDKVESTLGMSIAASVPTSPQVASSTNAGEPIVASLPRHPVSKAIVTLAEALQASSQVPEQKSEHPGRAAAPKRSLLRRNGR